MLSPATEAAQVSKSSVHQNGLPKVVQLSYAQPTPLSHKEHAGWGQGLIVWVKEERQNSLSRLKTRSSRLQEQPK